MMELPNPLQNVLHIIPSWMLWIMVWLAIGAFFASAIFLLMKRRRRKVIVPPVPPPVPAFKGTFKARIEGIVSRAVGDAAYRRGFHELAAAVREVLFRRTGRQFLYMTVAEMEEELSGKKLRKLLEEMEAKQFSAVEPDKSDLLEAGTAVVSALSRGGRIGLRRKGA